MWEESFGTKSESQFHTQCYQIKWIVCVQEKVKFSSISQRPGWGSTKISGADVLLLREWQLPPVFPD